MRISKRQLRRLIREEKARILFEQSDETNLLEKLLAASEDLTSQLKDVAFGLRKSEDDKDKFMKAKMETLSKKSGQVDYAIKLLLKKSKS